MSSSDSSANCGDTGAHPSRPNAPVDASPSVTPGYIAPATAPAAAEHAPSRDPLDLSAAFRVYVGWQHRGAPGKRSAQEQELLNAAAAILLDRIRQRTHAKYPGLPGADHDEVVMTALFKLSRTRLQEPTAGKTGPASYLDKTVASVYLDYLRRTDGARGGDEAVEPDGTEEEKRADRGSAPTPTPAPEPGPADPCAIVRDRLQTARAAASASLPPGDEADSWRRDLDDLERVLDGRLRLSDFIREDPETPCGPGPDFSRDQFFRREPDAHTGPEGFGPLVLDALADVWVPADARRGATGPVRLRLDAWDTRAVSFYAAQVPALVRALLERETPPTVGPQGAESPHAERARAFYVAAMIPRARLRALLRFLWRELLPLTDSPPATARALQDMIRLRVGRPAAGQVSIASPAPGDAPAAPGDNTQRVIRYRGRLDLSRTLQRLETAGTLCAAEGHALRSVVAWLAQDGGEAATLERYA